MKLTPAMTAEAVARAGYDGFRAKRPVVIPGLSNLVIVEGVGLVPRPVLMRVVAALQRKRR